MLNLSHTPGSNSLRPKGSSKHQYWISPSTCRANGTAGTALTDATFFLLTGTWGSPWPAIILFHICGDELFATKPRKTSVSDFNLNNQFCGWDKGDYVNYTEELQTHRRKWDHVRSLKSAFTQQLQYCKQKEPPVQTESWKGLCHCEHNNNKNTRDLRQISARSDS